MPVPAISSFSGAAHCATHSQSWIFSSVSSITLSPVEADHHVARESGGVPLLDVVLDLDFPQLAFVIEGRGDGAEDALKLHGRKTGQSLTARPADLHKITFAM